MTPEVEGAIREIAAAFPKCALGSAEDGQGGAFITVEEVPIPGPYEQDVSWFGFHIIHTYPYADIYPLFVRHDLSRRDKRPLRDALSPGTFHNRPAVQISRRSNRHNASTDTALLKLQKVIKWLTSRS
jgi:hypothetical protein